LRLRCCVGSLVGVSSGAPKWPEDAETELDANKEAIGRSAGRDDGKVDRIERQPF
jgi:hypothetical protein